MLYELIAVVRPGKLNDVKEIARSAGSIVLQNAGVVRGVTNWGIFLLPKPRTLHGVKHHKGHHFIMRFDSSARTQHEVRRTLGLDPRLLRYSVVRMGRTLDEIKDVAGRAGYGETDADADTVD